MGRLHPQRWKVCMRLQRHWKGRMQVLEALTSSNCSRQAQMVDRSSHKVQSLALLFWDGKMMMMLAIYAKIGRKHHFSGSRHCKIIQSDLARNKPDPAIYAEEFTIQHISKSIIKGSGGRSSHYPHSQSPKVSRAACMFQLFLCIHHRALQYSKRP